jgi:hypothetical protein
VWLLAWSIISQSSKSPKSLEAPKGKRNEGIERKIVARLNQCGGIARKKQKAQPYIIVLFSQNKIIDQKKKRKMRIILIITWELQNTGTGPA